MLKVSKAEVSLIFEVIPLIDKFTEKFETIIIVMTSWLVTILKWTATWYHIYLSWCTIDDNVMSDVMTNYWYM